MSGRPIGSLGHDEIAQTALRDVGFFCIQDAKTGSQMSAMEQNTSQFSSTSKAGWDFCQDNVLNDARIRTILQSCLPRCRLGYYQRIAEDSGHVFQLRKGGQNPDILLVHLWGKGSRAVYFPGSHLIPLNSVRAANRLWEVPYAALDKAGIHGTIVEFEEGGLAILDARLALEMPHGSPVTCGFATEEELQRWPKLKVPNVQQRHQMASVSSDMIGVHFE
ncbi:hypothetical protein F5B18DRAFT_666049 [Nemania serpens]|nr:hypothetical protein F5B18DRAFT_666049 [Nemania serpens]